VIDGVGVIADELLDLLVAARLPNTQLPASKRASRLIENFAHAAYAAHHALHVLGLAKKAGSMRGMPASAEASFTLPRLLGCSRQTWQE
jgi:hypothetical protein